MRDVQFLEVGMKNFGPYIDPMILQFENNSLTLMTGPNGIGKTMTLDAIPFTLYGSTSKGARGDDVVNNVVGRNCHTWVKLTIDGTAYTVDRYHKYTKYGNTVTILKEGDSKPYKKGQKETLPEIERLLCPMKSFMNTLMFGQKIKDFFTDLVDSDKKEIFRKILNLDRYVTFYKKADGILKQLKNDQNDLQNKAAVNVELKQNIETQIDILQKKKKTFYEEIEREMKELLKSIEDTSRIMEQWEVQLAEVKKEDHDINKVENEILRLESEEEKLSASKDAEFAKNDSDCHLKIAELEKSASELKQKIQEKYHGKLQEKRDYYAVIYEEIDKEEGKLMDEQNKINLEIVAHDSNITTLQDSIAESLRGLELSTCPTCLQVIDDVCKKKIHMKMDTNNKEIKRRTGIISDHKSTIEEILQKIDDLADKEAKAKEVQKTDEIDLVIFRQTEELKVDGKVKDLFKKVDKIHANNQALIQEKDMKTLEDINSKQYTLLKKAEACKEVAKKISEIEETIESLRRSRIQTKLNLKSKEAEEYDEEQLNTNLKRQRELEIEKRDINIAIQVVSNEIGVTEFWKSAFSSSGIPSMLIDEAVPFMNKQVAYYLDKLTNGRYIVAFDTLAETKGGEFRDKISVHVLDTHTRASSRIQLSGGQTRIVDIATILTLGDLQSNIQHITFNILLFDEIFDSLDEENIGFVSKVLTNMKIGKSIYLISHRHEDQLEADEVLVLN
jgi:DNA repair exonuclease SbcCD ATPase subunit